ncbi:conserved protein ycjX [Vibrio ishigakensis]|uniref:Conserved protein ycjX n=1 Tax=Vibrio ishigakensis TaxID=1481914 RepID=A0A0B8P582_9VIBR|nr:conserved protein ycjX [Vibrio ishigakensis]
MTGLSRAGKTAFITSFVNQLISSATDDNLPLLDVAEQGRLLGARRVPQKSLLTPRFNLDASIEALSSEPPTWPEPTRDVSEIRLAIKYQPKSRARKLLSSSSTLYLDLVDYPGEWLLDLPMLEMDYATWSESQIRRLEQIALPEAKEWLGRVVDLSLNQEQDDKLVNQSLENTLSCFSF